MTFQLMRHCASVGLVVERSSATVCRVKVFVTLEAAPSHSFARRQCSSRVCKSRIPRPRSHAATSCTTCSSSPLAIIGSCPTVVEALSACTSHGPAAVHGHCAHHQGIEATGHGWIHKRHARGQGEAARSPACHASICRKVSVACCVAASGCNVSWVQHVLVD